VDKSPTIATGTGWERTPWRATQRVAWEALHEMVRGQVLLVGGDSGVVAVLRDYFRHGDSYEVESIEYCDDALKALSQRRFDLMLLLSIFARWRTLPSRTARFGGIELLKQIRALDMQVPVLVISASTLAQAKREALANGAFAFILQPINLDELGRLVARALGANRHRCGLPDDSTVG
jgi:DNA-binding NtrC family response regulator